MDLFAALELWLNKNGPYCSATTHEHFQTRPAKCLMNYCSPHFGAIWITYILLLVFFSGLECQKFNFSDSVCSDTRKLISRESSSFCEHLPNGQSAEIHRTLQQRIYLVQPKNLKNVKVCDVIILNLVSQSHNQHNFWLHDLPHLKAYAIHEETNLQSSRVQ